jgi:HEAT repeat protein
MLLLLALVLAQKTPESWVERLASDRPEVRTQAEQELLRMGSMAVPALEEATRLADLDIVSRARECLERIAVREDLTPGLLAVPGLEERLRREGDPAWHTVFMEAILLGRPVKPYENLGRDDLAGLARRTLRKDSDPALVVQLLTYIGIYRLERARPAVEAYLKHEKADLRSWAAWTLIMLRGPRVLEEAGRFLKDPDPEVRSRVVYALCQAGIQEAVPRLLALASEEWVRKGAFESSLLHLGVKVATPSLEQTSNDPTVDRAERNSAARELCVRGNAGHIPHMRGLLRWTTKGDPLTADYALKHLGEWGDRASLSQIEQILQDKQTIQNGGLGANTPYVACRALYYLGAESSVPTLFQGADRGCGQAIVVLGQVGNKDVLPALRKRLTTHPSADLILALGRLGDRESAPALRKFLGHSEYPVREAACTALALLEDGEAAKEISALKQEASQARKIWAALGDDGIPDAAVYSIDGERRPWSSEFAPQLLEGGSSTHGHPRSLSVCASATSKAGISADLLLERLRLCWHPQGELVVAAALVRMGRPEGLAPLLEARVPLFSLNRLRRPEAFKRLEEKTIRLRVYAPYEEIHRRLAHEAGLALEGPPAGSDAYQAWANVHQTFEKWGAPPSIAQGFDMHEDDRWCVVLEEDRIRILPREEGMNFWRAWQRTLGK